MMNINNQTEVLFYAVSYLYKPNYDINYSDLRNSISLSKLVYRFLYWG